VKTIALVALVGASQGFLLCVVILAVGTGNRLAHRILAAFVFVESTRLMLAFAVYGALPLPPSFYFVFNVSLAAGPLVYLYVRALTDEELAPSRRMLVHFIPVLLGFLASGLYRTESYSAAFGIDTENWFSAMTRSTGVILHSLAGATITLIYSIASLRRLRSHEANIREQFSSLERIDLGWLRAVIVAGLSASIVYIGYDVLRLSLDWDAEAKLWGSIVFTIFIVYVISIGGLRQPLIFRPATSPIRELPDTPRPDRVDVPTAVPEVGRVRPQPAASAKYERSGLDDARSRALWQRLQRFMEEERPYLEIGLNLRTLAASLDAIPQDLSQAINTHAEANFYEFVNRHRVEEAKRLLSQPDNDERSLLDIGLDAGFNSQATFYKHFKKCTGMTPKAYRKLGSERVSLSAG
jgi:AraC-like DNA-binding protein